MYYPGRPYRLILLVHSPLSMAIRCMNPCLLSKHNLHKLCKKLNNLMKNIHYRKGYKLWKIADIRLGRRCMLH